MFLKTELTGHALALPPKKIERILPHGFIKYRACVAAKCSSF